MDVKLHPVVVRERAMLDRIEYHDRKPVEAGRWPVTSPEWIAFHRRRIEKHLDDGAK